MTDVNNHCIQLFCIVTGDNIKGTDGAMKAARGVVQYFDKSTQGNTKLLEFHNSGTVKHYQDQNAPVSVL